MVDNIYHEARGESKAGMLAVAIVTMNRVLHPNYPETICKVVYQESQFSWTKKYTHASYCQDCLDIAYTALKGNYGFKATHYHTRKVNPRWKLKRIATIGNHIFYY